MLCSALRALSMRLGLQTLDGAPYRRIMEMRDVGSRRLVVDLTDLRNYDNNLARR